MTKVDRSSPPPPSARRHFRFPPFERFYLQNGLSVYSCRMPEFPLVCLEALSLAGSENDPHELRGLASFHADLIDEGTARRSALDIARELERLGGGMVCSAGWNSASAELVTLAEELPRAFEVLADCWLAATFPPAEIERLREEIATDLLQRRSLPLQMADDRFARAVYGDSAYGRPAAGTPEGVKAVTRDDVLRFHHQHLRPRASALIVVGDFDDKELERRVQELFGHWPDEPPWPSPQIEPRVLEGIEIHLTDRPSSQQAQVQLGHALVPRKHEDFPALLLLNLVFGGKFTSRINLNLRERHGYTYGANSSTVLRRGPGPFFVRTAVSSENVGAAISELLFELRRLCSEKIDEKELRTSQDYLIGVFPSTVQTTHDVMQRLEALFTHGLPDDHFERYPELLGDFSATHLLDVAQRHLRPDRLVISVVGSAAELRPQLEKIAPVIVHPA